jgi:hypothetical protein
MSFLPEMRDVRFWHKADIRCGAMQCPLLGVKRTSADPMRCRSPARLPILGGGGWSADKRHTENPAYRSRNSLAISTWISRQKVGYIVK